MATDDFTSLNTQSAATINTTAHELVVLLNPYDLAFSEFIGTRAMLESEGIIPNGTEWPQGYSVLRWQEGRFNYWLTRERPPGAKGPRKQFIDCDWFCLRWELSNQPSPAEREISRKARELDEAIYRNSAKGAAERSANWERYWKAQNDKRFQSFKSVIPGLVPPKRGRRAAQQGSTK